MANAPWYMKSGESDGPSLKHHKANIPKYNRDPSKLESRFERGAKAVRPSSSCARPPSPLPPSCPARRVRRLTLLLAAHAGSGRQEVPRRRVHQLRRHDAHQEGLPRAPAQGRRPVLGARHRPGRGRARRLEAPQRPPGPGRLRRQARPVGRLRSGAAPPRRRRVRGARAGAPQAARGRDRQGHGQRPEQRRRQARRQGQGQGQEGQEERRRRRRRLGRVWLVGRERRRRVGRRGRRGQVRRGRRRRRPEARHQDARHGAQPAHPRGHGQVPPQPRHRVGLLRPQDALDARGAQPGRRPRGCASRFRSPPLETSLCDPS